MQRILKTHWRVTTVMNPSKTRMIEEVKILADTISDGHDVVVYVGGHGFLFGGHKFVGPLGNHVKCDLKSC